MGADQLVGKAVFFTDNGQEKMFRSDIVVRHTAGGKGAFFNDFFGHGRHVCRRNGRRCPRSHRGGDQFSRCFRTYAPFCKNPSGDAVICQEQSHENVLSSHIGVPHFLGGGQRLCEGVLGFLGKSVDHHTILPFFSLFITSCAACRILVRRISARALSRWVEDRSFPN